MSFHKLSDCLASAFGGSELMSRAGSFEQEVRAKQGQEELQSLLALDRLIWSVL